MPSIQFLTLVLCYVRPLLSVFNFGRRHEPLIDNSTSCAGGSGRLCTRLRWEGSPPFPLHPSQTACSAGVIQGSVEFGAPYFPFLSFSFSFIHASRLSVAMADSGAKVDRKSASQRGALPIFCRTSLARTGGDG